MKKRVLVPIDWAVVERAMLKSFRGQPKTDEEQRAVDEAWRRSRKKYAEVNARVRGEEITRIRRSGVM